MRYTSVIAINFLSQHPSPNLRLWEAKRVSSSSSSSSCYYYHYVHSLQTQAGCSAWFIVLGSGLEQGKSGPTSLFSFFLQGENFPQYLCCPQQCCFLDNFQPQVHANSLQILLKVDLFGSKEPQQQQTLQCLLACARLLQFHLLIVQYFSNFSSSFLSP